MGSDNEVNEKKSANNPPLTLRQLAVSKWEVRICFFVVWYMIIKALYQGFVIVQSNDELRADYIEQGLLEPSVMGYSKDKTNYSWISFKLVCRTFAWIPVLYTFLSCILRQCLHPEKWSAVCSTFSVIALFFIFGWKGTVILLIIFVGHLMCFLIYPAPSSIWFGHILIVVSTNLDSVIRLLFSAVDHRHFETFYACAAVVSVKSLMFFLDLSTYGQRSIIKERACFAFQYVYYPVNILFGPIVAYSKFSKGVYEPNHMPIKELLWRCIRLITWCFLMELLLHIPAQAMLADYPYTKAVVNADNPVAVFGYLYLMGVNFYLLYVEAYGWSFVFGRADGFDVPDWPTCITVVFSYAEMWRVFDRGLHDFMALYIYRPLVGHKRTMFRKIIGSGLCFIYVILYHGIRGNIFAWATLNFIQIIIELSLLHFYYVSDWSCTLRKHLSVEWTRRLISMLGGLSFMFSTFAFFCFVIGIDNAWNIYSRSFSMMDYIGLMFSVYFGVQIAIECRVRRLV